MSITIKKGQNPLCPKCGHPMIWVSKIGDKIVQDWICYRCGYNPSGEWAKEKKVK